MKSFPMMQKDIFFISTAKVRRRYSTVKHKYYKVVTSLIWNIRNTFITSSNTVRNIIVTNT